MITVWSLMTGSIPPNTANDIKNWVIIVDIKDGMSKKVIQHWRGYDSYGRSVERAERHDGQWFARYKEQTIFGMQWCKWYETDAPEFETTTTNKYTGEVLQVKVPFLCWGFNRMNQYPKPHCRLPKPPTE